MLFARGCLNLLNPQQIVADARGEIGEDSDDDGAEAMQQWCEIEEREVVFCNTVYVRNNFGHTGTRVHTCTLGTGTRVWFN